jgi:hypothetical protein
MEWDAVYDSHRGVIEGIERQLGFDCYILYLSGSYGDILPNLALLGKFAAYAGKPVSVLMPDRWARLAERFSFPHVKYYLLTSHQDVMIRRGILLVGRPFLKRPGYVFPLLPTLHPWVGEFALTERVSDFEVKRCLLGLPFGDTFDIPPLPPSRQSEIDTLLNSYVVRKNRTVLLSFSTNSNPTAPDTVQESIARAVVDSGFFPIFNSAKTFGTRSYRGDNINISDYSSIEIPCDVPFEYTEFCGGYIGSLHGLSNILFGMRPLSAIMGCTGYAKNCQIVNNGVTISSDSLKPERQLRHDLVNSPSFIPVDLGDEAAYIATVSMLKQSL